MVTGAAEAPSRPAGVFANRDFRLVFAAATASKLGIQVSYIAIPLLAVSTLDASVGQVGLLGTLSTVAFLVIGLPAGAWVDRMRKRGVQIAADLVRAALLGSVPVAWLLGVLTIEQLYAVVLLAGCGTVFFDVAAQSYLPHVVGRDRLVTANSRLASIDAANLVAGRSAGGYLVQLLTAPVAIAVNALTFLWSAACLVRIRRPEPKPEPKPGARLWPEVREGIRFVLGNPLLRPIALTGALNNLSVQVCVVILPVLFVRELGFSASTLGLFLATGGAGVFVGTNLARRLGDRFGYGRAMWVLGLLTMPVKLVVPFVDHGLLAWLAGLGWLLTTVQVGVNNVLQVSLRQRITPDRLLGRMNATMRFLLFGALSLGSALAGVVGELAGVRATLWVGVTGLALVWLPPFFSRLRGMRELPPPVD
jgi:predicted MFS family arabinose efflux permease